MRKQARRLWLGDWHRDEEPADPGDTVVIQPLEGEEAEPPERRRNSRRIIAGLAAVAFLFALGFAASSGDKKPLVSERTQTQTQTPPAQTQTPQAQPQVPQGGPPQGFGGPDLTGADATKAAEAALTQFPGEIERVTRGPSGGGYVVHVIQADGNEVHVIVDDEFDVQGSDANTGPRNFAPGTPG